jgi:hypothetical protein
MGTALRFCFAAWLLPLIAGFFSTGFIAGATSKLGASAVGPWMLFAVFLQLCFFAGASFFLFKRISSILQGGSLIGLFVVHCLVQLGLFAVMAFSTLVIFNR